MRTCRVPMLVIALGMFAASLPAQIQPVQAQDGRVVLHFLDGALDQLGLTLEELNITAEVGTAADESMDGTLLAFEIAPGADLMVLKDREQEIFQPYGVLGGGVSVNGGFYLNSPSTGTGVDFTGFRVHAEDVHNDGPGGQPDPDYFFLSSADDPDGRDFLLCYVKVMFSPDEAYEPGPGDHEESDRLRVKAWDLIITPGLAHKLGRADLVGETIGYGKLDTDVADYYGEWSHPAGQNIFTPGTGGDEFAGGNVLDVKLGILSGLNSVGHTGSFPNGRVGMSMATTSCNIGDINVTWLAAMNENHPGIAMQVYREMDNRFEQVAVSWIKHGFFALSSSQCTPCQNPSPGTFLGVGCSDTYGSGNNADRFWLGPRDEWDAVNSTWTCLGSYFDGTPVDCNRDENGSGNGPVDHRLEGFDKDFDLDGATYYYEAMYMVEGDELLTNNIGSRECTMNWNGNTWNFQTPSAGSGNGLLLGPAINRYGDMSTTARLGDQGMVVLAVDVTNLGNGTWRYEYALFNWTLDRKVRQFSMPIRGVTNGFYFHDTDNQAANDWAVTTLGKNATWTFNDVVLPGHKVAGALEFATIYNFGFTSNQPPMNRRAAIEIHETGPGGDLLAIETMGPATLALSADDLAPSERQVVEFNVRGGQSGALIAAIGVNGISVPPLILTPTPVPFVAGQANFPLTIPVGVSGLRIDMLAAEFNTSVVQLSNISTLAIQ